jgi:outer membrane lipoprotein carrier protein
VKRALIAITLALAVVLPASAYELNEVLTNIENADKSVNTIRFDFVQNVRFTEMNNENVVKGQATFAKPNRMRIEKTEPDRQVTISDGKTMWVYTPSYKQAWQGSWQGWVKAKAIPPGLVPVGGYVGELRKRFNLSLIPTDSGVRLAAEPKQKDLGYSLEIAVSTVTWMPSETLYRSDSAVVRTALSQVQVNPDVPASDFTFKAPSGVDVIPLN